MLNPRARRQQVAAWIAFLSLIGFVAYVWIRDFANVMPLSPDYPKTNANPNQLVELRVFVPRTLNVQLFFDYRTFHKDCTYWTNFPLDKSDLTLSEPVEFEGAGEQKRIMIAVDKYLPGKCNWYLADIRYSTSQGAKVPYEQSATYGNRIVGTLEQERHSHHVGWQPKPGELREGRVDLWCSRHLSGLESTTIPRCTTWALATGAPTATPPDPVRNAAGSDKGDVPFTHILASTRVVEIYFHDADAAHVSGPRFPGHTGGKD